MRIRDNSSEIVTRNFKIPWNASYVVRNMVDPQNIIEHNPPADHGVRSGKYGP